MLCCWGGKVVGGEVGGCQTELVFAHIRHALGTLVCSILRRVTCRYALPTYVWADEEKAADSIENEVVREEVRAIVGLLFSFYSRE